VYRATPGRSPTVASDRIQQRISDIRGGGTAEPNDINPRDWLADILACHLARPAQRFPILELEATEHRNRDLTAHVWQNEPNFQQKKFSEMESAFLSLDVSPTTSGHRIGTRLFLELYFGRIGFVLPKTRCNDSAILRQLSCECTQLH
jgi:hypothetical protein